MNFACHQCERRYSIADEKVRGRTVKVRCKACQTIITVHGEPEEPEESTRALSVVDVERLRAADRAIASGETPPPLAPPVEAGTWFVMIRGAQQGPWTEAELGSAVKDGRLTARSFCWKEGMADWKRAAELPELARLLPKVAPPPSRASAPRPTPESIPPATGRQPALEPLFEEPRQVAAPRPENADSPGVAAPQSPMFESSRGKSRRPDPFASLTEGDGVSAPPPGEATQFFMAQAGVNRRNPPWKIALFVLLGIGLPMGLLYGAVDHGRGSPHREARRFRHRRGGGDPALLLGGRGRTQGPAPRRWCCRAQADSGGQTVRTGGACGLARAGGDHEARRRLGAGRGALRPRREGGRRPGGAQGR